MRGQQLGIRSIFHERAQIFDAVENEPDVGGQRAVAAAVALGGFLQYADAGILFARRECGRTRRAAGADDQDVVAIGFVCHLILSFAMRRQ